MYKKKSLRMQPVNKLANKMEQESAIVYAQCLAKVRDFENQLRKLYIYRDEYNRQILQMSSQGVGSHQLQDCLNFINNLNQSIDKILALIKNQQHECEEKKKLWLEKHNQKRIYAKVTEKFISEEQRLNEKLEQKLNDEFSQNLYLRKLRTRSTE